MIYISDELSHYGVRGMKWGVRKQMPSAGGTARRALAGVYGINERFYRKTGNKALASMNAVEKNRQLKKAQAADIKKQQKAQAKQVAKIGKIQAKKSLAGNARRTLSSVYALNERYYKTIASKSLGSKTLASMNAVEKNRQLKKAQEADEAYRQKLLKKQGL